MKNLILFLTIALALVACKPTQLLTTNTSNLNNVNNHSSVQLDSVYIYKLDSVYFWQKGDTVFKSKTSILYRDRWHNKTDSVYKYINQNINHSQTITKTITVEKQLTWWQELLIASGKILLSILILILAWYAVKNYSRFSKLFP